LIRSCASVLDTSSGTMRSLSPCAMSVGTVSLSRSARKSVVPKARMHYTVPSAEAFQAIHLPNGRRSALSPVPGS
jgi:hypothetical protein